MKETLKDKCPHLVAEWSKKNYPLLPEEVTVGSHKRVWWKGRCGHEWQAIVKNRVNGTGCPYCSGNALLVGFNDLASKKPELISEWADENSPLMPDMVSACSLKKVFWKCVHGHKWEARIADRYYGSTCPYCAGQRVYKGFNDLAYLYPQLALEWSEKNNPQLPRDVSPHSTNNVWWKCSVCSYEWKAVIRARVKGLSCPVCADRVVMTGYNDLRTTNSEMVEEWDFKRNTGVMPENISRYSQRIVWWKCRHGHHWRAKIANRVFDAEPCRVCYKQFQSLFPDLLLRKYLQESGLTVVRDEEELIGIPLSNYIAERRAVIEISKPEHNTIPGHNREYVKNDLCKKNKIRIIRILKKNDKLFDNCAIIRLVDNTDESMDEGVRQAIQALRIKIDESYEELKNRKEILFKKYLMKTP